MSCTVSEAVKADAEAIVGRIAEKVSGIPSAKIVQEMFDEQRAIEQIELLKRYIPGHDLRGKTLLELGSGPGIVNLVARTSYGIDAWGVEPERNDGGMLELSHNFLTLNKLSVDCICNGKAEAIPFPDNTFDIVFSENVLEHVIQPAQVLAEAIRVCKVGGTIHMVFPNYGSLFDGHYASFHIPYQPKWMNRLYVRYILHRDISAVDNSRTEINLFSVGRWLKPFIKNKTVIVVGYGEDIFRERMMTMNFSTWAGLGHVKRWVAVAHRIGVISVITNLLVVCKAITPIILTMQKHSKS